MLGLAASGSSGQSGPCNVLGGSEVRIHLGQCNRRGGPRTSLTPYWGLLGLRTGSWDGQTPQSTPAIVPAASAIPVEGDGGGLDG